MATYEYEIGTTVGNRQNVEDLVGVPPSLKSSPPAYGLFRNTGVGDEVADGFLSATWHFDYLARAAYMALEGYITGQASVVHIKTRERDGSYTCYTCYLHKPKLPSEGDKAFLGYENVVFRLTHMASESCT
jgi:hypothetical protein